MTVSPANLAQNLWDRCNALRNDGMSYGAVVTARVEGSVTNGRMQEITGAHPAQEMRATIQRLCQDRWLAASEIAALLLRDPEKLQSRFLSAMVREGQLEVRFPDVPNQPDQAYRTSTTRP